MLWRMLRFFLVLCWPSQVWSFLWDTEGIVWKERHKKEYNSYFLIDTFLSSLFLKSVGFLSFPTLHLLLPTFSQPYWAVSDFSVKVFLAVLSLSVHCVFILWILIISLVLPANQSFSCTEGSWREQITSVNTINYQNDQQLTCLSCHSIALLNVFTIILISISLFMFCT